MLYTRKGDGGSTGLFGTRERVPKDHPQLEALGSLDELNSFIGLCKAYVRNHHKEHANELAVVQEVLFIAQAQVAGSTMRVTSAHVSELEADIDAIETTIEKPSSFVVPGATVLSALFDYARTVARRTERTLVRLHPPDAADLRAYLNRLSSLFYALARHDAQASGSAENAPTY